MNNSYVDFNYIIANPRKRFKHTSWYNNEYYSIRELFSILSKYNETDLLYFVNSDWIELEE